MLTKLFRSHRTSQNRREPLRPVLEFLEERLAPAFCDWFTNVNGSWFDPSRWRCNGSPGVPGPGDNARIPFFVTVDVPGNATVTSLDAGASRLNLGGTLTLQSGSLSALQGSGGLTVTGSTVSLQGPATYSGQTSITGFGTLEAGANVFSSATRVVLTGNQPLFRVSGPNTVGSIEGTGTVTGSGPLTVGSNGLSTSFAGVLSVVSFVKLGGGTLGIFGHSGTTMTVSGGTLQLDAGRLNHVIMNAPGTLDVTRLDTSLETLSGNGAVQVGSRRLTLLYSDSAHPGTTFGGTFTGNGTLSYSGGSRSPLILAGNSSSFTGTLEVAQGFPGDGNVVIDGDYRNTTVRNVGGAVLSGTGTTGRVELSGGPNQFTPGRWSRGPQSAGRFTTGPATLGGTVFNAILSNSGFSQLVGNGPLQISGSQLQVLTPGFSPPIGSQFTIIQGGSITGTFNNLPDGTVFTTANGTPLRINYTANSVVLTRLRPVTQCRIAVPPTSVAGTPFNVTVSALNDAGTVEPNYRGTISLTTNDPRGTLAGPHTYTAADQGAHTFSNAVLRTAGLQTITARDAAANFSCTAPVTVNPAAATRLALTNLPATVRQGQAVPFTVTAVDEFNNQATNYPGTVRFTSSDGQATVPPNAPLSNGTGTFNVTFNTLGNQSVTVTDVANPALTATASSRVRSTAVRFEVVASLPSVTAGQAFNVTVTALNADNSIDAAYNGVVRFGSNDGQALLPGNATLTNGVGTFSVTLYTAGSRTITANDTALTSILGNTSVSVDPAALSRLLVTGLANPVTAGTPASFTVTASDPFGNRITGYRGTVRITSTDGQANLPPNYTFTVADNGSHTFTPGVTFNTLGIQSLTATDTVNGTVTGTASTLVRSLTVRFDVTSPISTPSAGRAFPITVTARNAQGAVDPSYRGTVRFSSGDPQAVLPANYTFTAADAGVRIFSVTLRSLSFQNVFVHDVTVPTTGGFLAVTVTAAWSFSITNLPASVTAGTLVNNVVVRALDQAGSGGLFYQGTVSFTSSDPTATLPPPTQIRGQGDFTVTFRFGGTHTLTVTDLANPQITGSATTLVRSTATFFTLTASTATPTAGLAFTITVTARNPNNSVDTSYGGTITFISTDPQPVLPANYTFQPEDRGVKSFSVTLRTAGFRSVTARDTAVGSITGMASVTVSPAEASQLVLTGLANPAFANTPASFTLTARDPFGNLATGYRGTVLFSSSDTRARFEPESYTFTAADNGSHFIAPGVTFRTAGTQSVTARDTVNGTITGTVSTLVRSTAAFFIVEGPFTPQTAGQPFNITVSARNPSGTIDPSYVGTACFRSGDDQATLPDCSPFRQSDEGVRTFSVTLRTVGNGQQFVEVRDRDVPSIIGIRFFTVSSAAASRLEVSALLASITAGVPVFFVVTPRDPFGNVATSYRGTVRFTSSDGQATLPPNSPVNGGPTGFNATFRTAGNQTVTVTDVANDTITGSGSLTVLASFATRLEITGLPSAVTAGELRTITVTARDQFGNQAPGYRSTAGFTSTDAQASLPANYTFTAADEGQRVFTVTFRTAGPQSLTVRDVFNGFGMTVNTTVNPGPVAFYYLFPDSGTVIAGQPFDLYVFPYDEFWNHIADYTGEIAFFSTDEAAVLPEPYTFQIENGGAAYFFEGVTFNTSGLQELYVFDTATYLAWGYAAYDVQGRGGSPGGGAGGKGQLPAELGDLPPQLTRTATPPGMQVGREELEPCFTAPREVNIDVVESVLRVTRKQAADTGRAEVDDLFARLDREYAWLV